MNEFEYARTLARLIIDLAQLYYKPAIQDGGIVMIEKWELKYPN